MIFYILMLIEDMWNNCGARIETKISIIYYFGVKHCGGYLWQCLKLGVEQKIFWLSLFFSFQSKILMEEVCVEDCVILVCDLLSALFCFNCFFNLFEIVANSRHYICFGHLLYFLCEMHFVFKLWYYQFPGQYDILNECFWGESFCSFWQMRWHKVRWGIHLQRQSCIA